MFNLAEFLRKKHNDKYVIDANGMRVKRKNKTEKTVQDIEISKKWLPLRITLFVVFLAGGITAICFGVSSCSAVEKGWHEITCNGGKTNAANFNFTYYFSSDNKQENGSIYKALCNIYTQLSTETYFNFTSNEDSSSIKNIYYINHHPNEDIDVSPLLYKTLYKLANSDNKVIYYAPIYEQYQNLYNSVGDDNAKRYDPYYNENAATLYKEIMDYVNNNDIYLSFPGENHIKLNISDEYLNFLNTQGFKKYIDMWYFEDAASIDYFVENLENGNFKNYRISSYEGYVRSGFDESLIDRYYINYSLYSYNHNYVLPTGTAKFVKPFTLVEFKKFPVSSKEDFYFYADKNIVHHFLDPENGKYLSSIDALYLYSENKNVSLIDAIIKGSQIFINDKFSLNDLFSSGYDFIYHDDTTIRYSNDSLTFSNLLTVKICNNCGTAFDTDKCPKCQSEDYETLTYKAELLNV